MPSEAIVDEQNAEPQIRPEAQNEGTTKVVSGEKFKSSDQELVGAEYHNKDIASPQRRSHDDKIAEYTVGVVKSIESATPKTRDDIQANFGEATTPKSNPVFSMPPPQLSASRMRQLSQKSLEPEQALTPSEQRNSKTDSVTTQIKAVAQSDMEDIESDNNELLPNADLEDPESDLERFDWPNLHLRHFERVREFDVKEHEIMSHFVRLCDYFAVWSEAGTRREVDRSCKRIKTQAAMVQQYESQLEQKRQHYIKVVDAFKNALELLSNH